MSEMEIKILDIDNKKYFLVDSISNQEKFYHYFSNLKDNHDILVMTDKIEDDNDFYVSIDDDDEFDYALSLFYDKFRENEIL